MIAQLSKILFFLLIASSVFAQTDSAYRANCDSLHWTCDSLVKAQDQEIGQLRRALDRRDNELLLQSKIAQLSDSMHNQFFGDLRFELEENKRMSALNEKYYIGATIFILTLSVILGQHIR